MNLTRPIRVGVVDDQLLVRSGFTMILESEPDLEVVGDFGRGGRQVGQFLRLQAHFAFAAHFCRVRQAHEKGHVENGVGYVRRNFLVPVPVADRWEELNDRLAGACRREWSRTAADRSARRSPG